MKKILLLALVLVLAVCCFAFYDKIFHGADDKPSGTQHSEPFSATDDKPSQSEDTYRLDPKLFEDIGLTLAQLGEKYGAVLDKEIYTKDSLNPMPGVCFSNDSRAFVFENTQWGQRKPVDTDKCVQIFNMRADSVFPALTKTTNPEALAEQYAMEYFPPAAEGVYDSFFAYYTYNGYAIQIVLTEPGEIKPDGEVMISKYWEAPIA